MVKIKMLELKLCPFCGGKPVLKVCDGSGSFFTDVGTSVCFGRQMTHKLYVCSKCRIRTQPYLTDKGVWNAWNRRANDDKT